MDGDGRSVRVKRSLGQGRWQLGVNGQAAPARSSVARARAIVGQVAFATTSGKKENEEEENEKHTRTLGCTSREKPFLRPLDTARRFTSPM